MILRLNGRRALVWEWPNGKMAWFLWGWRPSVFPDTRYWRIGPVTFSLIDRNQNHAG